MLWDSKAGACGWEWLVHEQWGKAADLIRQRLPKEMTLELGPEGQEGSVQVTFQAELQQGHEVGSDWYVWGPPKQSWRVCAEQGKRIFWSKIPSASAPTEVMNSYSGVPAMTQE